MSAGTTFTGVSCHLSWYGIIEDAVPVVQCLFIHIGRNNSEPKLQTFIVRADPLPAADLRVVHRGGYANLAATADGEERQQSLDRRSSVLARVLLEGSALIRVLAHPFSPVQIRTDQHELEILEAAPALDIEAAAVSNALSLFHVAKMVIIGSYPDLTEPRSVTVSEERVSEEYGTHANKKMRRGYYAFDVAMSFRIGAHKYVLERDDEALVSRLFEIREVSFLRTCLRIVTPIGFIAVAVTDEQCCLLLKSAWTRLYEVLFRGFAGQAPLCDYLGPDLFEAGGSRSFFFPGFPPVPVYPVNGLGCLLRETALDAAGEVISWCGLPDIVGSLGKLEVQPSTLSLGVPEDEWRVFGGEDTDPLRINGTAFRQASETLFSHLCTRAGEGEFLSANVHAKDSTLHHLVIVNLVESVVAKCILARDFNTALRFNNRLHTKNVCKQFIDNLRYRSGRAFWQIQSLLGYISQHVTSACTSAGLLWVLSRGFCEFYVYDGTMPHGPVSAEMCVRTVVECYWRKLFGDVPGPVCRLQASAPGIILLWGGMRLVSPFGVDEQDDWWSVVGQVLGRLPALFRKRPTAQELESVYREVLFRFVSRRNDVDFWLLRCDPGEHEVRPHVGVIDCAPFYGVWSEQSEIIVQSRDSALAAEIGYTVYLKRAFVMLTACMEAMSVCNVALVVPATNSSSSSSAVWPGPLEEREEWLRALSGEARQAAERVITEGSRFFRLNV
ncbi:protein UL102 [Cynomolgus macaque cytomegalovirus strain Ottawa]|uniref:Protein UL102 n=1 Tax=macacine betaherpesvirus 8 TaxID=2560567 RepID=G8H0M5_9BETA|nr:protein UL102 [Cynomolgus macaque cytomegalovirus strain Ottawa]AEQ32223.1 protein UL102 [Cynomolgus macaque cytomegalovirus strain Ottawa]